MNKMDNEAITKTQKELNEFLKKTQIFSIDPEELKKRCGEIFDSPGGQRLVDLAVQGFDALVANYIKQNNTITQNDKANILIQIFVILEKQGFINLNLEEYARSKI